MLLLIVLTGCSTASVDMKYKAPASVGSAAARPLIAVGDIQDKRPHDPRYLGAILGGYGNPLKTLESTTPVSQVVHDAFVDGLRARGLLASSTDARYILTADIIKLDGSQYMERVAHIDFVVTLANRATGATVYSDSFRVELADGFTLEGGIFGSTDKLRDVVLRGMQQAIDAALDSAGVQRAIAAG